MFSARCFRRPVLRSHCNYRVVIDRIEFYSRRDGYCLKCSYWKGACLKGHALSSPQGCPIKKFAPINGAGYAPDKTVLPAVSVPQPGNCCSAADAELKPMSWSEAGSHLASSMAEWARTGFKTAPDDIYSERVATCQDNCPSYRWFQCRLCRCFVFSKAKVPHETCPAGRWKR